LEIPAFQEALSLEREAAFILKSKEKFLVAGYASVYVKDLEGERISLKALDEAFKRMMKRKSRRNYMLHHGNIQIGELLWEATDSNGITFRSGVDFDGSLNAEALKAYGQKPKRGLFVVCEVFDDLETSKEVMEQMKRGRMLNFSIGGRVLPGGRQTKCEGGRCFDEITRLELNEITDCEHPVNPEAKAFILKGRRDHSERRYIRIKYSRNIFKGKGGSVFRVIRNDRRHRSRYL